jgi:hypothetical protein
MKLAAQAETSFWVHNSIPLAKGAGHGSTSRAFYARPRFLAKFIKL